MWTQYQDIVVEAKERIGTIRLNRPDALNAIRPKTSEELIAAFRSLEEDDDVSVVILTGTGKAFCAGDDVKEIFARRLDAPPPEPDVRREAEALRRHEPVGLDFLSKYSKPTIASINGVAVGYGCDIALQCDFRVAAESARIGEIFIRRGLIPEAGGLLILPMLVGWEKAHELVLTGDIVEAREAYRIGMVGQVVPDGELETATWNLALRLTSQPPLAQRMAKEGLHLARHGSLDHFFDYARKAQELMFRSADHREGVQSFLEKRPPTFTGR